MKVKHGCTEAELRKAANRAVKHVIAMAKREPTIILIANSTEAETDQSFEEITAWLFKRRQDDGNKRK